MWSSQSDSGVPRPGQYWNEGRDRLEKGQDEGTYVKRSRRGGEGGVCSLAWSKRARSHFLGANQTGFFFLHFVLLVIIKTHQPPSLSLKKSSSPSKIHRFRKDKGARGKVVWKLEIKYVNGKNSRATIIPYELQNIPPVTHLTASEVADSDTVPLGARFPISPTPYLRDMISTYRFYLAYSRQDKTYQEITAMPMNALITLNNNATIPRAVKPLGNGATDTFAPSRFNRSTVLPAALPSVGIFCDLQA